MGKRLAFGICLILLIMLAIPAYFFRGSILAVFKTVTHQPCSLADLNYQAAFHTPLGLPVVLNKPQYDRAVECTPLQVYFKTSDTDDQIATVLSNLKSNQSVYSVDYVSKEQAVEKYKQIHQNEPIILEIMPKGNFYPAGASVYVNYQQNKDQLTLELKTDPLIDTVIARPGSP